MAQERLDDGCDSDCNDQSSTRFPLAHSCGPLACVSMEQIHQRHAHLKIEELSNVGSPAVVPTSSRRSARHRRNGSCASLLLTAVATAGCCLLGESTAFSMISPVKPATATNWQQDVIPELPSRSPVSTELRARPASRSPPSPRQRTKSGSGLKNGAPASAASFRVAKVEPLTTTSAERRTSAIRALQRQRAKAAMEEDMGSVAARFLESLEASAQLSGIEDQFGFVTHDAKTAQAEVQRPRGRPESVPGAMNFSTMMKLNERDAAAAKAAADLVKNRGSVGRGSLPMRDPATILNGYRRNNGSTDKGMAVEAPLPSTLPDTVPTAMPKRGRGRPRKHPLPSAAPAAPVATNADSGEPAKKKRGRKPGSKNKTTAAKRMPAAAGSMSFKNSNAASTGASSTVAQLKKRKGGVKSLSNSKDSEPTIETKENQQVPTQKKVRSNRRTEPINLQKYYRTELLTAQEEYSLGMKIQFMMQCEQVHEGLCIHLMRLPTISEWAYACGFKTPDPEMSSDAYFETDLQRQIRPAGSDQLFEEKDPNMFVGNGLATEVGVGRGKGRAKNPPPIELGDFYDDSVEKFAKLQKQKVAPSVADTTQKEEKSQPINRGTPRDFVDMMLTAREAKQRMVQCNMRLVVSIARKYHNVGVNLQDLVQEGSLGLARAAEKFEPSKGFKFSTYASWWIQQAVFRSIAYHSRTIRLPVHVHNLLNRVRRVRISLQQELGRTPTNDELAEELDMTPEKFNKMLRLTRRSISLEMPKYQNNPKDMGHESDALVADTISSTVLRDENTPEFSVDQGLFQNDLQEMLKILGEDESRVIRYRYGLEDGLTRTVTAVAAQMKQSKSWVRSQECRALRKLRRPWYEQRLREHQKSLTS